MTRLARHYNRKHADPDFAGLVRTYFHSLKAWALDDIIRGAERILETSRRFPLVAEWNDTIADARRAVAPLDARQMGITEIAEHERAYALHYTDHPCLCVECVRAGVDHLPIRFVPLDDESAFNPKAGRRVPVGYWLHGDGLKRWYAARDRFLESAGRVLGLEPARVLVAVGASREPGEDD